MGAIDYDAWAQTYDTTRGASPSVLEPLLEALGPPEGRSLLDIGCGTGNFAAPLAEAGFRVTLCDFSPRMVRRAFAKLLGAAAAVGDAQYLPFRDGSFDCAISIKVLNHIPDWRLMLREARRAVRLGPVVLVQATRETMEANWVCEYVPSLRGQERYRTEGETADALRGVGFGRVEVRRIRYRDVEDGSAQALKHFPEAFLANITNTSLFHRLSPEEVARVLASVRRDLGSGRLREVMARYEPLVQRYGDGSLFVAYP